MQVLSEHVPARDSARTGADALMGLIFGFALLSFMVTLGWIMTDFGVPLLQLLVLLLTFAAVTATGFLYFLNPARFLTFFLIGLVYFSFEATIRSGSGGGDAQSVLKGLFTLALATLGLFTGLKYLGKSALGMLFFGYAFFALVSASYSPQVLMASVAGIALVGVAIISAKIGVSSREDVLGYWRAMYWASVLTATLSLIYFAVAPMQARDFQDLSNYRLRGITGTANSLGPLMAVGCFLSLLMFRVTEAKWWKRFYAVFGLLFFSLLIMTNSRSSILGMLVAYGFSWILIGRWGPIRLMLALIGLAVGVTVMVSPGLQEELLMLAAQLFSRTGSVYELTTLTGRKLIWDASWRLVQDAPWIGYGLSSVQVVLPDAHADQWGNTVATAHNLWLESLLSVGWLGTLVLAFVALYSLWLLCRRAFAGAREASMRLSRAVVIDHAMTVCAVRCLTMMLVQGFNEKAFAGHPGSPFLALGAVVATAIYITHQGRRTTSEA